MNRKVVANPIHVGQKFGVQPGQAVPADGIRDSAEKLMKSYRHRRSRFLDIDYKIDDDGHIQFHIFPRVPDHENFYPNNQAFASALEESAVKIIGRSATIEAEFHEADGAKEVYKDTDDGKNVTISVGKEDTRVRAYYRLENGDLTHVMYKNPVPMVWVRIVQIPGLMMPKEQVMEILVENFIEATERLVPRA